MRVDSFGGWREGDICAHRSWSGRYRIDDIYVYDNGRLSEVRLERIVFPDSHIDDVTVKVPRAGGPCAITELETICVHELRVAAAMRARGARLVHRDGERVFDVEAQAADRKRSGNGGDHARDAVSTDFQKGDIVRHTRLDRDCEFQVTYVPVSDDLMRIEPFNDTARQAVNIVISSETWVDGWVKVKFLRLVVLDDFLHAAQERENQAAWGVMTKDFLEAKARQLAQGLDNPDMDLLS